MQSKDRRIIIYLDMNDLKKQYRTRAKDIWTLKNVLENEEMINSNLFNCLGDLGETIMAYISMKDEVNILSSLLAKRAGAKTAADKIRVLNKSSRLLSLSSHADLLRGFTKAAFTDGKTLHRFRQILDGKVGPIAFGKVKLGVGQLPQ